MAFEIIISPRALKDLKSLEKDSSKAKRFKAVKKTLRYLANNPKHPSLNTHEFTSMSREQGYKVFEAYAENRTPGAYRVFWCYGPEKKVITILAITPHP